MTEYKYGHHEFECKVGTYTATIRMHSALYIEQIYLKYHEFGGITSSTARGYRFGYRAKIIWNTFTKLAFDNIVDDINNLHVIIANDLFARHSSRVCLRFMFAQHINELLKCINLNLETFLINDLCNIVSEYALNPTWL